MKRVLFIALFAIVFAAGCSSSEPVAETPPPSAEGAPIPLDQITDPNVALAEGIRLLDENQTAAAIEAFRHAIKLNPDLADAYFQLGIAYALLEMQNQLTGVVSEEPASNSKSEKSKTDSEKAFEKAVEAYEKRIKASPEDHAAHFNLGRTYVKLLKDEEAEKAFKQAVKLKPDDTEYQTELGAILIRLAQYHEAIGPLKKAIELDPSNARAADLLEDAQAGRQRVDYIQKNTNQPSNKASNSNANAAANSNSNSAPRPSNTNTARPDPKKTPAKTPERSRGVQ